MQNGREHVPGKPVESPLARLVRDMNAIGRLDEGHPPAAERVVAELGDDLLAALDAELRRLDAGAFPLCSRPRRVA